MCIYFFHLYSCGCAHIDLKRTLLAHCLAVNKAVACWHIQVKYQTLEVNCPGTTLPQPRPCPLVFTREQLAQTETLCQRHLREDLIKKIMGSFNGNVELQRSIIEELDQDLEAAKNRAKQVETRQWSRNPRHRSANARHGKTDFLKSSGAGKLKEGNPVNLQYPPGYLAHIQALDMHQHRLDLSPNTIIEDIAYGCGRKSNPVCLAGHIREGKLLCPWLIVQRLRVGGENHEELKVSQNAQIALSERKALLSMSEQMLKDAKCRGGARLDLDNPSESEFIRSGLVYTAKSACDNRAIAAEKEVSVIISASSLSKPLSRADDFQDLDNEGILPFTDLRPSCVSKQASGCSASTPRSFPLHFEYGTHTSPTSSVQDSPRAESKEIRVATSPSSKYLAREP